MTDKSMENIQQKCEGCGGNLRFSPDQKSLVCNFCQSATPLKHNPKYEKHKYSADSENKKEYADFVNKTKVIKCSNCGASIILDKLQVSKNCPYCDSPSVAETNNIASLAPDAIIPFKYSEEKASEMFKKGLKSKWFLPNKFKKSPPVDKIKGIYVPCFAFDAKTDTKYSGVLEQRTTDSNGNTKVKTIKISGEYFYNFENFIVESSSHITQDDYNQIRPYQMSDLVKFDPAFIMGYSVEYYNQNLSTCKSIADRLMREDIKAEILKKYSYSSVKSFTQQTSISDEKYAYNILPLYKVGYKYGKKEYISLMNGQTGKVGGNLPRSKVKITFFVLMWVIIAAIFIYLFIFG